MLRHPMCRPPPPPLHRLSLDSRVGAHQGSLSPFRVLRPSASALLQGQVHFPRPYPHPQCSQHTTPRNPRDSCRAAQIHRELQAAPSAPQHLPAPLAELLRRAGVAWACATPDTARVGVGPRRGARKCQCGGAPDRWAPANVPVFLIPNDIDLNDTARRFRQITTPLEHPTASTCNNRVKSLRRCA